MTHSYQQDVNVLYEIAIRPVKKGVYPARPPTAAELAELKQQQQKKAPAKYVPPHLRNKAGASGGRAVPGMKYELGKESMLGLRRAIAETRSRRRSRRLPRLPTAA